TDIRTERVTEPFSGMPLLRVTGYWQGPRDRTPPFAVEVCYDEQVATRCGLTPADAADVPARQVRLDFGTQLPVEPDVRAVRVRLHRESGVSILLRRELDQIGRAAPARPGPGLVGRAVQSLASGEAFSLWRWKARLSRLAEKLLALRQKVRYRLLGRRFRP